jgi:rhodanese-related sulfurtransferase
VKDDIMFGSPTRFRRPATEGKQLVDSGATLLDVRTPAEFANGHCSGAINIPVQILSGNLDAVPRDRAVVVYCRSGGRSAAAAELLAGAGFTEICDVGPMPSW